MHTKTKVFEHYNPAPFDVFNGYLTMDKASINNTIAFLVGLMFSLSGIFSCVQAKHWIKLTIIFTNSEQDITHHIRSYLYLTSYSACNGFHVQDGTNKLLVARTTRP